MKDDDRQKRRAALVRGVVVLAFLALLAPAAAQAGNPSAADIQWAQQVLKEKGFDPGRPNGELTAKTRAALMAYQKSSGLAQTGQLDAPTQARMLAGRNAAPSATMGNLAAPQKPAAPVLRESEVVPRAAPAKRVDAIAAPGGMGIISSVGTPGGSHGGAVPQAAPRTPVTGAPLLHSGTPPVAEGQAVATHAVPGADDPGEGLLVVPAWVRWLIMAVIAGGLGGFGWVWWRSGRPHRQAPAHSLAALGGGDRHEPSFDHEPGMHKDELRVQRLR